MCIRDRAYRKFEDIEGFCRVVSLDGVKKNDYNLSVTLYVMPIDEIEHIDLAKEYSALMKLDEETKKITDELKKLLSKILEVK